MSTAFYSPVACNAEVATMAAKS